VRQTTGKSRKEACLLSQQDAEKTSITTEKNAGALRRVEDFFQFLGKVQQEMKLVHHPDWQQVRSTTLVVIVFVFLFAMYLRTLDWIFSPLEHWLFSH
jgi:preprotein translocase SecE subunit